MNRKEYNKRLKAYKKLSRADIEERLIELEVWMGYLLETAEDFPDDVVPPFNPDHFTNRGFYEYAQAVRMRFMGTILAQLKNRMEDLQKIAPPSEEFVEEDD